MNASGLKTTGANNISEIWPNLELYMHGGINFSPYQNQFNKLIPSNKMHYLETYNASEGFFAIQDQLDKKDMLLMLDYGIFYEFIKKEDFYQNSYNTITLENTEAGTCLLYTSPSPRDGLLSRMPSSA
mgnify:CR=1 FL=1